MTPVKPGDTQEYTPIICVDFDGVLHSYESGWKGVDVVSDPPVVGAINWLNEMSLSYELKIAIYSSRSKNEAGIEAMKKWLLRNGFAHLDKVTFPNQKPAAFLTIDDRAICFKGVFPTKEEVLGFKPWNK